MSPVTVGRFFRLIGAVAAATVGLILVLLSVNLLGSTQWASATGTVQKCTVSTTGTGSSRHTTRSCVMTWQDQGKTHSDTVDFSGQQVNPGQTFELKVNGDSAVRPSVVWVDVLMLVGGLTLLGVCVFLFIRSRRAAAASS
jgi:hypothetical protein